MRTSTPTDSRVLRGTFRHPTTGVVLFDFELRPPSPEDHEEALAEGNAEWADWASDSENPWADPHDFYKRALVRRLLVAWSVQLEPTPENVDSYVRNSAVVDAMYAVATGEEYEPAPQPPADLRNREACAEWRHAYRDYEAEGRSRVARQLLTNWWSFGDDRPRRTRHPAVAPVAVRSPQRARSPRPRVRRPRTSRSRGDPSRSSGEEDDPDDLDGRAPAQSRRRRG